MALMNGQIIDPNCSQQWIMGRHFLLPFHKGWSSVSCAMEAIKEALKLLSLVFGELEQLLLYPPRRYFRVCVIYSGNLQKQIGMHTWSVKYFRFHSRRCAVINSSVESNQTKRFKTKKKYIEESTQSVCWLYGLILITDDWQHERTNLEGKLVSRVSGEFVFNPFLLIKQWLCCKQLR